MVYEMTFFTYKKGIHKDILAKFRKKNVGNYALFGYKTNLNLWLYDLWNISVYSVDSWFIEAGSWGAK